MRQLGKKNDIQDGTLVAFGCPCDCTSVCNLGASSCTSCANQEARVSLQTVNKNRALNYGGREALNQLSSAV